MKGVRNSGVSPDVLRWEGLVWQALCVTDRCVTRLCRTASSAGLVLLSLKLVIHTV